MDKSIELQHQIKQSAESIRDYTDDLGRWEEEINSKDKRTAQPLPSLPPVRARATPSNPSPAPAYKRDLTDMHSYYKSWDRFNVDEALQILDSDGKPYTEKPANPGLKAPENVAPARTKVVVRGGRTVASSDLERMKDQGALHFTGHDYEKAFVCYQNCLSMSPDSNLRVVLHSNSAQCLIHMRDLERAESEANAALDIDPKHVKSLVRRGVARRGLAKFGKALEDFEKARDADQGNTQIAQEIAKTKRAREIRLQDIKDAMVTPKQLSARVSSLPKTRLSVIDIDQELVERKDKVSVPDSAKAKELALDQYNVSHLGSPTSLTDLEKNSRMLAAFPVKMRQYFLQIDVSEFSKICEKSTIESDFLMFVMRKLGETMRKDSCEGLIRCIAKIPRLSLVTRFLTKREKAGRTYSDLKDVLTTLECSQELKSLFGQ